MEKNVEELMEMVQDINSWDGSMEHLQVYDNDGVTLEMIFGGSVEEALRASSYGSYDYLDAFVRLDVYGNLETFTSFDYADMIIEEEQEIRERYAELKDEGVF